MMRCCSGMKCLELSAMLFSLAILPDAEASTVEPVTILDQPGWCNWCPSPAYLPDGRVALAFSRWPTKFGFETWKAKSEIALAISKSDPLGPYEFVGTILPGSGVEGTFDRDVTHNPCLFVDGGKYYLYYMGTNSGDDHNRTSAIVGSDAWKYCGSHQQVGVAVADRVEGPYRRTGKPLFELAPDMTTLSNPAICRMPNGKYLMIVKWGEKDRIPRGYPKCRVNHFAAVADNPLGPFEIVNREVFSVPCANFPGEDPYLWVEGETICCAIHDMGRFYSNEDRALIRFESKDGVNWRNCGVLFPRGNISRLERPAILCGKDGSRLLFAASKPDEDDPNSMIVAYPGVVPEPLKAKPAPEPLRFVTFNIWGDYFKNPVGEREDGILSTILRLWPDVLSLQEVTPSWWGSKLFAGLEQAGYGIVRGDEDAALVRAGGDLANRKRTWVNHEPLVYATGRLRLLDSGLEFFHLSIGAEKSVTWAVFEDRRDGRRFISFATHLWWQYNGDESEALRELNVRKILDVVSAVKAKWGELPVIGGGDMNCKNEGQSALVAFERAGYSDAGKCADVFSTVPSEHTDPVRGADGRYHGEPGVIGKKGHCMLDRVYYTPGVHATKHDVDVDQRALDSTDHSPVVIDFIVRGVERGSGTPSKTRLD